MERRLEKPLFKGRRNSEASVGFWLAGVSHSDGKPVELRLRTSFR